MVCSDCRGFSLVVLSSAVVLLVHLPDEFTEDMAYMQ